MNSGYAELDTEARLCSIQDRCTKPPASTISRGFCVCWLKVELAALDSSDECSPLIGGEDQCRSGAVLAVPDGDRARKVSRDFYAVRATALTLRALTPFGAGQVHGSSQCVDSLHRLS